MVGPVFSPQKDRGMIGAHRNSQLRIGSRIAATAVLLKEGGQGFSIACFSLQL